MTEQRAVPAREHRGHRRTERVADRTDEEHPAMPADEPTGPHSVRDVMTSQADLRELSRADRTALACRDSEHLTLERVVTRHNYARRRPGRGAGEQAPLPPAQLR